MFLQEKEIESLAGKKEGCHDDVEFITVQRNKTLPAGANAAPAALPSSALLQPLSTSSVDLGHPAEVGMCLCDREREGCCVVTALPFMDMCTTNVHAGNGTLPCVHHFVLALLCARLRMPLYPAFHNMFCSSGLMSRHHPRLPVCCRLPLSGWRSPWAACVPAWATCPPGRTATHWCSLSRATTRTAVSNMQQGQLVAGLS